MKWIIAVLILSLLVLFHEFGHYIMARLNGVEVEEFSLGFGPRLLSAKPGRTRYSIKLLPFGGSCRMKGMMEYLDGDEERAVPEAGSYMAASVGRRAAIIFGGPLFNFILAFICSVIVISFVGYDPPEVMHVTEGSPAWEAGLRPGDMLSSFMGQRVVIGRDIDAWFLFNDLKEDTKLSMTWNREGEAISAVVSPQVTTRFMLGITYHSDDKRAVVRGVGADSPLAAAGVKAGDVITAVDGTEIPTALDLSGYFEAHPLGDSPVHLKVERDGEAFEADVTPASAKQISLGFDYNLGRVKTNAPGVLRYALTELRYWIVTTVRSVGSLFTGRYTVDDLSGPVGVVDVVGTTYEEAKSEGTLMVWMNMLNLIILLSANLGVMNLLPIPALDGGKLVFLIIEGITGKPVNRNVEAAFQTAAAILLMALMVYVMYHDVTRLF